MNILFSGHLDFSMSNEIFSFLFEYSFCHVRTIEHRSIFVHFVTNINFFGDILTTSIRIFIFNNLTKEWENLPKACAFNILAYFYSVSSQMLSRNEQVLLLRWSWSITSWPRPYLLPHDTTSIFPWWLAKSRFNIWLIAMCTAFWSFSEPKQKSKTASQRHWVSLSSLLYAD